MRRSATAATSSSPTRPAAPTFSPGCASSASTRTPSDEQLRALLRRVKEREANGYAYEGAAASFELLARRALGQVPDYFRLMSFRIIDERRFNARNELVTLSEATIKVEVGGAQRMIVAEGNGPVNALDAALRQALTPSSRRSSTCT